MKLTSKKSTRGPTLHYYADRCGPAKRIVSQNEEETTVCDWCERKSKESYENAIEKRLMKFKEDRRGEE